MSKQLTVSAAFSIFTMASFVLFGGAAVGQPMSGISASGAASPIELSAPLVPTPGVLLPSLR
jgi:hypothetical protein